MNDLSALAKESAEQPDYNTLRTPEHPKKRTPRRILHFSDGILEEYSTDEEEAAEREAVEEKKKREKEKTVVDPRTLRWLPWMLWLGKNHMSP
jgi:hypothetical protein